MYNGLYYDFILPPAPSLGWVIKEGFCTVNILLYILLNYLIHFQSPDINSLSLRNAACPLNSWKKTHSWIPLLFYPHFFNGTLQLTQEFPLFLVMFEFIKLSLINEKIPFAHICLCNSLLMHAIFSMTEQMLVKCVS